MVRKRKRKTKQKNVKSKHKKSAHEIAMQNLTCGSIWRVKTADEEVNKTGKTVLSGWKRCQVFFLYFLSRAAIPTSYLLHAAICFFPCCLPCATILFYFILIYFIFCYTQQPASFNQFLPRTGLSYFLLLCPAQHFAFLLLCPVQ